MKFSLQRLIDHCVEVVDNTLEARNRTPYEIRQINGESGFLSRKFFNYLGTLDGAIYCEVGAFLGSLFIPTLLLNKIEGYCIENWAQYDKKYHTQLNNTLIKSCTDNLPFGEKFTCIFKDCLTVTKTDIPKQIDIFCYSGPREAEMLKKTIAYYKPFFSPVFIIVIDNWEYPGIKEATVAAFNNADFHVKYIHEFPKIANELDCGGETYWNGYGLFVCEQDDYIKLK